MGYRNRKSDMLTEVAMLSSFQASPRQEYMEEALHIFAFLKNEPKLSLYFDFVKPKLDPNIFNHDITPFKEH